MQNATENNTGTVNATETKLMQFGKGKYSKIAASYAAKAQDLFGFSDEQADKFGHTLMADMGRLNMSADKLKFGKTTDDGMVKVKENNSTDDAVVKETPAFTICAGINALEKALERIPGLSIDGTFELPKNLQFNKKAE